MDIELAAMTIIAHSGDSKSLSFQALNEAKKGNFEEAKDLMVKADEAALVAHRVQTEILVYEAQGNASMVNVLLIHAQDHLMTGILAKELIVELIALHEEKKSI